MRWNKVFHQITKEICTVKSTAHQFNLHDYVVHKEITFHLCFPERMSIGEAHHYVTLIEERIQAELAMSATIHIEPIESECPESFLH